MIKAAVLGYGTVGSGVVEVLDKNKELISKRVGDEIDVKYILDLRDFPGDPFEDKVIHDFNVILEDPEVSIVCETMGGTKPAYQFTKDCLIQHYVMETEFDGTVAFTASYDYVQDHFDKEITPPLEAYKDKIVNLEDVK